MKIILALHSLYFIIMIIFLLFTIASDLFEFKKIESYKEFAKISLLL
jgi:hypothetical protein